MFGAMYGTTEIPRLTVTRSTVCLFNWVRDWRWHPYQLHYSNEQ